MTNINTIKLIDACDYVQRHCIKIADTYHGSAWLFDKLMRLFETETSCTSVTIPVILNAPILSNGEATIGRDGSVQLRRSEEA